MKNDLEFCFIGNCQLCVIGWALKMMNPDTRMFWVSALTDFDRPGWTFRYFPDSFMLKGDSGKDFLSKCDFLLYNHINPNRPDFKSWCSPKNTKPHCTKLSITSMFYHDIQPDIYINKMIEKENKHNIDIRASEIFQTLKTSDEQLVGEGPRHHNSSVYRQLLPVVAKKLELNFDYEIFRFLSENGFPFNKTWGRGK